MPRRALLGTGPFMVEEGMDGVFTRDQAEGAIPNGTTIVKINSEPGDTNPDGDRGVVLGSVSADSLPAAVDARVRPQYQPVTFAYFIEWENIPKTACGCLDRKVKPA